MIYEVKKTITQEDGTEKVLSFEIDDMVLFDEQPTAIRHFFDKYKNQNEINCDNCLVNLIETGRLIVSPIMKEE